MKLVYLVTQYQNLVSSTTEISWEIKVLAAQCSREPSLAPSQHLVLATILGVSRLMDPLLRARGHLVSVCHHLILSPCVSVSEAKFLFGIKTAVALE